MILTKKSSGALECVTLSQDAKYRVKNKIHSASSHVQKHTGRKLSSAAVIAVTLVSLLVITGAAVGISMFSSIYGEKADVLTPYGTAIYTSAQNDDVVLTLHESVADEYATAYIFSIKGLTDAGKALIVSNTLDPNAYETAFLQVNGAKSVWPDNKFHDDQGNYIKPTVIPPEITDCKIYNLRQKTSSGNFVDYNIGLRCDGVTYNAIDNTAYTLIPIESLREENREYYALYVITPETYQLTLTFDGLELSLPEATTHIPGVEIKIDGYIQDYFLNEEGMSHIMSKYPVSAVLTPLGLYVNDNHTRSLMYKTATLVFNDGSELELSGISNEKSCVAPWKRNNLPRSSYQGAVYLFNEIIDISTVKSLLFYNEIEFPFDGSAPFVRSSGRTLKLANPRAQLWSLAEQILKHVDEICPDTWTVSNPYLSEPYQSTGWSGVNYVSDDTVNFQRMKQNFERDAFFTISLTETASGTLEDEARAMVEEMNIKHRACGYENDLIFNVTKTGIYNDIDVLVVECGESQPGLYKRCIFTLYEGKLLTIEYDGYTGQPTDYAFDALLALITF